MYSVRLTFDRGTLVVQGLARAPQLSAIPGLVWDDRVGLYRAPARAFYALAAELRRRGVPLADRALPKIVPPAGCRSPRLRPEQHVALAAWRMGGGRGVLAVPGASTRTDVALAAIGTPRTRVLCLVADRPLAARWTAALRAHGHEVDCLDDRDDARAPVVVATFAAACRSMWRLGDRFGMLVIDEVEHFGRGFPDDVLEMSTALLRLGLTGTPPTPGLVADRIAKLVGPLLLAVATDQLPAPYLRKFARITWHLQLDPDERGRKPDPAGAGATVPRCQRRALAVLLDRHRPGRTLVLVPDDQAARAVSRAHQIAPITAATDDRERRALLLDFTAGRLPALVAAPARFEAVDLPRVGVGVVLGAQWSGDRQAARRASRLLRPPDGSRALVYQLLVGSSSEVGRGGGRTATVPLKKQSAA